jgi:hypothetical protein
VAEPRAAGSRARRLYLATCWLPLAAFAVASWEIGRQEGWTGWAVAGTLGPLVVGFSAVMSAIGALLWILEWRKRRPAASLLLATLVAASVLLWFAARVFRMELERGS